MNTENKVRVYAPIDVQDHVESASLEKASALVFPEEKQGDLQYIRSILVSAGTNKNGAHFLPSEMMKAHNTVVHKAIDIEHEEDKVIGHIYESAFLYKDGSQFDPQKVMAEYTEAARDPDELDIDIAVAGVIHKMRFPEYAEEISSGDWKVSMECYFKEFDLLIGNTVITRDEAQALGYDPNDLIGGFVKVMAGQRALGKHVVARVLRDITYSGMGIVKNPANPHSIIMETAAHRELMQKSDMVIDLEQLDGMRGTNKVVIREDASDTDTKEKATEVSIVNSEGVPSEEKVFIELDNETGGIKRILTMGGSETAAARWSGSGIGGPGSIDSFPDSVCKSFKKRLTKFNALDQSEAVVIHEHYCALFEEACPVIGASAKAPECLRNVRNRTTRDEADDTLTKTIREVVEGGPANTFQTVLSQPVLTAGVNLQDRQDKIFQLREDAKALRNSLRPYIEEASKKKTLE